MPDDLLRPAPPPEDGSAEKPLAQRLGWFVLIAGVSAVVVIAAAYFLRTLLFLG